VFFGFLLSTIFIPDISGAATAPRWAFAAVALPLLMMTGESRFKLTTFKLTTAHVAGLAFIWYTAITLSWTAQVYDGLDALIKLVIIAEAFVYGSSLVSLRPVIIGFGLGMWVSGLVILTGLDVPHVTDNAGLFVNSNSMGEIAGLVLVAALFYREPNLENNSIAH
jgi:hypothetical protein